MLAIARDRGGALGLAVNLREASAGAPSFPGASLDAVVCTGSLCDIPGDRAAVGEMHPGAAAGGRLVQLDHVASDRRWVLAVERPLEPLGIRLNRDYLTRRPLPLMKAAGLPSPIAAVQSGIIERPTRGQAAERA